MTPCSLSGILRYSVSRNACDCGRNVASMIAARQAA